MNNADKTLQKELPTLMVPIYEKLPPCSPGRTRLLMARDGLYIEAALPWVNFIKQLWQSPKPLPYGTVEEDEKYEEALEAILNIVRDIMEPLAAEYADRGLEWVGWILWNKERGFFYLPLEFEATDMKTFYLRPELPEETYPAAEVHSHHTMIPDFSEEDDGDEKGRLKISICLGSYNPKEEFRFTVKIRHCIEGFFFGCGEDTIHDEYFRKV